MCHLMIVWREYSDSREDARKLARAAASPDAPSLPRTHRVRLSRRIGESLAGLELACVRICTGRMERDIGSRASPDPRSECRLRERLDAVRWKRSSPVFSIVVAVDQVRSDSAAGGTFEEQIARREAQERTRVLRSSRSLHHVFEPALSARSNRVGTRECA